MRDKIYSKDPTHIKRFINGVWSLTQALTGRWPVDDEGIFKNANTKYRKDFHGRDEIIEV